MSKHEFNYTVTADLLTAGKSVERVDLSKGKAALVKLKDGETQQVRMTIDARFHFVDLSPMKLGKKFEVSWSVDVESGKLNISQASKPVESDEVLGPGGNDCSLVVSDKGDTLVAIVTFEIEQWGAANITDTKAFVCALSVDPKSLKKTWPKIPRDLTKTSAYFGTDSKKGRDSADLPPSSLRDLEKWARDIEKHEEVYAVIAEGLVPVWLEGNTSRSGSKEYNARLAKLRIDAVERVLTRAFGSTKMRFVPKPKAQSKFEEQADYRVDVFFNKEEAELIILGRQS